MKKHIDRLLQGTDAKTWLRGLVNKLGQTAQGVGKNRQSLEFIKATNTIWFIAKHKVPPSLNVAYANFICNIRPLKEETHRVCMAVGGDKFIYEDDPISSTVSFLGTKIFINIVISDALKRK